MSPKQLSGFTYAPQVVDPSQYFALLEQQAQQPRQAPAQVPQGGGGGFSLSGLARAIAHPFAEFGTALAYTPKAIYREIHNRPIDDIQQRIFGTTNQGDIAKKIISDTAQVGLSVAAPSTKGLTLGQALRTGGLVGAGFGGASALGQTGATPEDILKQATLGAALGAGTAGVGKLIFGRGAQKATEGLPIVRGSQVATPKGAPVNPLEGLSDSQLMTRNYIKNLQHLQGAGAQLPSDVGLSAAAKAQLLSEARAKAAGGNTVTARMFARAFNVPSKLAPRLKPIETSRELISHGVNGSLDKMSATAEKVTGDSGILTKVVRKSVQDIGGDIKTSNVLSSAKSMLAEVPELSSNEEKRVLMTIVNSTKAGALPDFMNPLDALSQSKQLESIGYRYFNAGINKLNPNPKLEGIGKAYLAAADELKTSLEKAAATKNTLAAYKTPEIINQLKGISPKLANQFQNAKSLSDVRAIQAPFVRLNQMIGLTNDAAQTVLPGSISGLGARAGGAGLGFAAGGPLGAAAGFLAAPFVEGVEQGARAPIATKLATALAGTAKLGGIRTPGTLVNNAGQFLAGRGGMLALKQNNPVSQQSLAAQYAADPTNPKFLGVDPAQFGYPADQTAQPGGQGGPGGGAPANLAAALGGSSPQTSPYPIENVMHDIQRDPKNASFYQNYYNFLQKAFTPPQQSKVSVKAQDAAAAGNQALAILDSLEQSFNRAGGAQGRIGGTVSKYVGKAGLNDSVSVYNSNRTAFLSMIARTLGERGVLTDKDIERIAKAIPSPSSTKGEARAQWDQVRSIIGNGVRITQSAYAAPNDFNSPNTLLGLSDALQGSY